MLDSQVGQPDVGLRTFTPVGGLLWYKCSPVCDSPIQQLWDLILLLLRPSYHLTVALLCLWMWGILLGEFQCLPVNDHSAVSCDSGALARGSESMSFYSAILNQSKIFQFLRIHSRDVSSGLEEDHPMLSKLQPRALLEMKSNIPETFYQEAFVRRGSECPLKSLLPNGILSVLYSPIT